MKIRTLVLTPALAPVFVAALLLATGCSSTKQEVSANDTAPAMPKMTPQQEADMKAYEEAGKLGPMHALLAKNAGTWKGTSTMWMEPGAEGATSDIKVTTTKEYDGRYLRSEYSGEMPGGMGPFVGEGTYGFDNVSQKFVATWVCNCSTGIMNGEGVLGSDGKTITWTYTMNCPIRKGPTTMRDIETHPSADTMKVESWCTDPHSGKEFKMMQIDMKRVGS